jgi:hypothetical protein
MVQRGVGQQRELQTPETDGASESAERLANLHCPMNRCLRGDWMNSSTLGMLGPNDFTAFRHANYRTNDWPTKRQSAL